MAQYSKDQLRTIFQNRFNQEAWKSIVVNIFGAGQVRRENELITDKNDPETGYFLGFIDTPDSYRIGLFYYKINSGSVAHKKVGFRNLLKKWVNPNWGEFEAAIVVFDDGEEWRLSFICDIKEEVTAPKRFTYVFGEHDNFYKTPVDRFEELQKQQPTFENIRKTFSVDALSDDFFDDYRELYADFVEYITGKRYVKSGSKWEEREICKPNYQFQTTFEGKDKLVRDYIKKMFGRIVFLYFLQRKGWLNGNKQYMHALFYDSDKKDDFLDGVLEPLFFEVLNEEKPNRTQEAKSLPGCENIPYLNGGLFARDEIDERTCVFPSDYFKRLFDFLDSYNFTIDENDTDDAEIGIDPEMLGRIFENLLEDNKDKGAFYTPKEIVDYMCRESLIAYLIGGLPEIKDEKLRLLVEKLDTTALSDKDKLEIRKALQKVKICDPAIGSGAFPMGLVNLLSKIYVAMKSDTDTAKMKRHIMEQNIYGVDIEKGAVDIARLRFWLAMIVEEKEPIPLPNLHFKIMQGNSLLESYNGIDLSDLTKINAQKSIWDSDNFERENLIEALRKYYKTSDHIERDRLFNEIINNVRRQLLAKGIILPIGEDPSANTDFFLWHTWFSDVFAKGGFDIVIGNPPYIQIKKLPQKADYAKCNFEVFISTGDIYCLFYELANNLLSSKSIGCYITSNKWLRSSYGNKLRNFFVSEITPKILIDLGPNVFENAGVDTNILLWSKEITYEETKISNDFNGANTEFRYKNFNSNEIWSLVGENADKIKNIVSKIPTTIDDFKVNLNYGILTGANPTFILSEQTVKTLISLDKKNSEVIKPILRGKDIFPYGAVFNNVYLLCLHNGVKKKGIPPIKLSDYPTLEPYLRSFGDNFYNRGEQGDEWYNLRNCAYIEDFEHPKILYSDIVNEKGRFYYDEKSFYSNDTAFMISSDNPNDLKFLTAILNSTLFTFCYRNFYSGGGLGKKGLRYKKEFIRTVPIPIPNLDTKIKICELVDKIQTKLNISSSTVVNNIFSELDILIYHLYNLTYDEVLIIDPETPITQKEYEEVS